MLSSGVAAVGGANDAHFPHSKAIILIGGPNQQGNHFRPLSLDLPKPLFQLAGREMLYFHVEACARVPNLQEILMIGSYDEGLFSRFFDTVWRRFNVQIRYLRENKALGTAGGIRFFRNEIMEGNPASLFVLHCDFWVNASSMMKPRNMAVLWQMLQQRRFYTGRKNPRRFVGDKLSRQRLRSESNSEVDTQYDLKKLFPEFSNLDNLRLEQDILLPLADQHCLYLHELGDFWCQIKTPGMAITCSELYMQRFRFTNPSALSTTGGKLSPIIEGNVVVDSSANVHPTAKLGPNVTIAAGVTIGPGVRIAHSIILEGVTIKDHACVLFSIIGWNSIIGQWARVEGQPPNASQIQVHSAETALVRDVTIFGVSVVANPEVIIRNCIVLPHKTLAQSYHDEILL
ncbi:mannose-1-phosphate guanylyltransferase [Plasmopara halstedii]|uniref:Mannose-1-phosphate guanylyltransferase n=1 Tax=Plasmopara halstedii TaxID=4781 RepID=A0A0N7L7A7_PLAHL|nr:mannose-1-phosphate guanylyltransferase [Plasmopara halstedii]CEG46547.1 mannose-1-phosphate guanylyltransferase [Plasmopara halstedii]|eukprot:XP_024582916.1 mannose-1-phosphate guanylyltransferase [Plasmopara halstedii]